MKNKKRHVNIPVFIPHLGCPNDCVFCNQRKISGHGNFERESVKVEIEGALATVERDNTEIEIAFFGGSFTGIDRELMIWLLELADSYVKAGQVDFIRLSTRPDYIDGEIVEILSRYAVKTVELGVQSISARVLFACRRGHSETAAEKAFALLSAAGFDTVGQMMIGLPGANLADEIMTAQSICEAGAIGARIYPTVVFRDTELCEMAVRGEYTPLDIDEAIFRSKEVLKVFEEHGVQCIRIGLQASESLSSSESVYGGASHPALGELVEGELFYDKICYALDTFGRDVTGVRLVIEAPLGSTSKVIGQKKKNVQKIKEKYKIIDIKVIEKPEILRYNIKVLVF